mgnify:CR=1 FL=1
MQTILQNRLPVKLFVINNQGYHSIRQTQQSYFKPPLVGVGEESGDLSFPDLSRIMPAYGFPYRAVHASEDLEAAISEALDAEGAFVCEVFVTKYQKTEPKTSAKKLPEEVWCPRRLKICIRSLTGKSWNPTCSFLFRKR